MDRFNATTPPPPRPRPDPLRASAMVAALLGMTLDQAFPPEKGKARRGASLKHLGSGYFEDARGRRYYQDGAGTIYRAHTRQGLIARPMLALLHKGLVDVDPGDPISANPRKARRQKARIKRRLSL